jgi:hypothetical protein
MKNRFCGSAALALALAFSLFAAPVWAADDDRVKGLWVELPDLPEAGSTSFSVQAGGEGEAYYERILEDGMVVLSVERIYAEDRNGDMRVPADAGKLTVSLQSLRKEIEVAEENIDVTESIEELAEIYSCPVAGTIYMTGENEDMRGNQDIFIFTDEWIFRIHTSIAPDYANDPDNADKIKNWLMNLKIVDRDSPGSGESDEADEDSGGERSDGGDVIELFAGDADLSEAPDVVVEGDPENLGGWKSDNTVIFNANVPKAGSYRIILIYSKEESVGDKANLRVTVPDYAEHLVDLPPTGSDWSNYEERSTGIYKLPAGGVRLILASEEPDGKSYVMNLRSIKVTPPGEE